MFFNKLRATLNHKDRISSVDVWRGIAILGVVLYHFDGTLPYGHLGVDLFFVISGLLVGGLLTRQYFDEKPIKFIPFFFKRGFKIWPSYLGFILLGSILANLLYNESNADQIIPVDDLWRYVFFYRNYTGGPTHWSFDHLWSLCVEEHFYILLPLIFIGFRIFKPSIKLIFISFSALVLFGFVSKIIMLYFSNGQDTYSATHNRIDALAWGVILNLIITLYGEKIKSLKRPYLLTLLGILMLSVILFILQHTESIFFQKVLTHSLTPISFFLMILGSYYINFYRLKSIRIIGYYSYNWYLWHPVFVIIVQQFLDTSISSLLLYLIISFFSAVLATLIIEEPFLKLRNKLKL